MLVLKKNAGEGKIWEALKENTFCQRNLSITKIYAEKVTKIGS